MGTTDISIEELGRAFSEAKAALADDAALNWIRNSALTERAYLFGLLKGLESISGKAVPAGLVMQAVQATMWAREADDRFSGTPLGKHFGALMTMMNQRWSSDDSLADSMESALVAIASDVDRLCTHWRGGSAQALRGIDQVRSSVSALRSASSRDTRVGDCIAAQSEIPERLRDLESVLRSLEEPLRHLALLDTDYDLTQRRCR